MDSRPKGLISILLALMLLPCLAGCLEQGNDTAGGSASLNDGGSPSDDSPSDSASVALALSWQPNPGPVDGYIVHEGPTAETATTVVSVTHATTVKFDAYHHLGLKPGDTTCFRIKAYNEFGESDFSDAACFII
jgi:hypothetical protein